MAVPIEMPDRTQGSEQRVSRVLGRFAGLRAAGSSWRLMLLATTAGVTVCAAAPTPANAEWAPGGDPHDAVTQLRADAIDMRTDCSARTVLLFRARGSGEEEGDDALGQWTFAAGSRLADAGWRVRDSQVIYGAARIPRSPQEQKNFLASMFGSGEFIASQITFRANLCPTRKIVLAGYSQGNAALRTALPKLSRHVRDQIVAVVMVSDPSASRARDDRVQLGMVGQSRTSGIIYNTFADRLTGGRAQAARVALPADLEPRVVHYCKSRWDPVCNNNNYQLNDLTYGAFKVHTSYPMGTIGVETAKRFLAHWSLPPLSRSAAANHVLRVAATGTAYLADANGTPHWIPDVWTYGCVLGRGSTVIDGLLQSQVDALGNGQPAQGQCMRPSDAANHVLRVSATGTAYLADANGVPHWIPDGGTYNCLIAAHPLIDGLAQAHVDSLGNGQPWATCSTATPSPPPPPPTWAETTGGATNTWTNYTNAGGTQGATIPAFTTVRIACRLTGFAVADGNTWWYRIASSPWSGAFYASADAFYNNGATSGSLAGTPFVDPNVATC